MKKNKFLVPSNGSLKKLLLTMKLCLLFILISAASLMANSGYSQNTRLSIHLKNATLRDLISEVEKQSEYIFVFYDKIVDLDRQIDVQVDNQTIDKVLDEIIKSSELTYRIFDRQIGLGKRNPVTGAIELPELLKEQIAADTKLTGSVKDAKGLALPGVTVMVKGTTIGTVTNNDGTFSLSVPVDTKIIVFSFVGMKTQEVVFSGKLNINITMAEEQIGLDDVVVVGYGIQRKVSVVGAISQVKSKELVSSGVRTLTNALSGLVPGLVTQQNSGQPGKDAATIFIRGRSSWQSSNPLVLVDGIERSMTDIDPNEVESISVLKDASATAVYGTRGGNGVILVTTRRGTESAPKMSFTFNQGFKSPTGRNTYVDSYNTMLYANEAKKNDNNWSALTSQADLEHYRTQDMPLFYPSVDWSKVMVKKMGYETDLNFNVSGGTAKLKYFGSFGYMHDGDVLNTSKIGDFDARFYSNRYNLRTNVDYEATKTTTITLNVGGSVKTANQPITNILSLWRGIYYNSPTDSPVSYGPEVLQQYPDIYEPNASGTRYAWGSGLYGSIMSPITAVYAGGSGGSAGFTRQYNNELNVDLKLNQNLDFVTPGLSVSGILSYNVSSQYTDTYSSVVPRYRLLPNGTWQRSPDYGGDVDVLTPFNYGGTSFNNNAQRLYYEGRINYARRFEAHDLSVMGVVKRSKRNVIVAEPYKDEDWAGRVTYNYDLRYLFEANLSLSGSEQFAPGNRFGFFPAFAVGWNMAQEGFIKNSDLSFINNFKTRFTWGKVGTTAGARWLYYPSPWTAGSAATYGGLGGSTATWNLAAASYNEGSLENADAQWEESTKKNLGFEAGIFDNMITLNVDFFDELREKILMPPTFQIPAWGAFSGKDKNIGSTKNHGYEVELMFNRHLDNGVRYYIGGNMSFNENRVLFRGDPTAAEFYQKNQGYPIGIVRDMLSQGLYQSVDDINNYIAPSVAIQLIPGDIKFTDYNADGKIDANDSAPLEFQTYPRYDYSIKGGFEYKNFTFNIMVQGNVDKIIDMYGHFTPFGIAATGLARIETYQFDHYTPDTPNSTGQAYHFSGDIQKNNNFFPSSGYDAKREVPSDYVRLKQAEISYNINSKYLKGMHINSILVYINGNNLLTFSPLKQKFVDPEKPTFLAGQGQYDYPMARRFNMGIKLTF